MPSVQRRKVWLTPTGRVPCTNAANIGERKSWTQSEVCTSQNSPRGQKSPKMYIGLCTSLGDGQTLCKVWLASGERRLAAVIKPRRENRWNLLGCPKPANRCQLLVASKFAILLLWGHLEEILLFNKFFSDCPYMPYLRRYSPTKLCNGAQATIFLGHAFPVSRLQHISDLHSKFALRPHHV